MYIRVSGSDTANRKNTRLRFDFKAWEKDLFLPRCEIRRASYRTTPFSGEFFLFFSPLDYNSINSGKIPGAWTFVKLIVNLQLYGNKGNFPCFLFTNEYLSGGTFIRVGIILVIFPQIATPAADWNDVFDASNEGPGCPNLDQTDLKSEDCLRLNVYTGKVFFFFLSKLLHTNQAMYIRTIISFYLSALSSLSIGIISNYVNFCTRVFETLIVTRYSNQYKHYSK